MTSLLTSIALYSVEDAPTVASYNTMYRVPQLYKSSHVSSLQPDLTEMEGEV